MKNLGTHLIMDAWQCPPTLLNDPELIRQAIVSAVEAGGATLIHLHVHPFSPHGVTATATLAESHIAIHTWPEYGYFAADVFFCGHGNPHRAVEILRDAMQAGRIRVKHMTRGFDTATAQIPEPLHEVA